MTQQLSPAAQKVQFAAFRVYDEEEHLYVVPAEKHAGMVAAAALRAAADQVVPLHLPPETAVNANHPTVEWHVWNAEQQSRFTLLAIAAELEAE